MRCPTRALQLVLSHLLLALYTEGGVTIQKGPKHQRVRAGVTVHFSCQAAADSLIHGPPVIVWRKDDERLKMKKNPRISRDKLDYSLTIVNASIQDTGVYTCIASTGGESDSASAQLIVEDVPDPPIDVQLVSCEVRIAQIQWRLISENYSPVSQFIIQYNTSFDPDYWHVARTQLPRDRFYQRIALSPWGNYSFRVVAQNGLGMSKPSIQTKDRCTTPPDVPHHNPKDVCTVNDDPHKLVISWHLVPKEEHNAPGFYYLVKWRRHDLAGTKPEFKEVTVEADVNRLVVDDQPIYKPYDIYVLAINSVGEAVYPPKMHLGYSSEDIPLEVPHNFRIDPEKEVTDTTADFVWDAVNTGPWRMQGFFRGYKIQFWRTDHGKGTMREHSIIYREPEPCGGTGERHRRDVSSGHVYNLWPYTNVTACIVVLNVKYQSPASDPIHFRTAEGTPEGVSRFEVLRRGSTDLLLGWSPPKVLNGILIGYSIGYEVIEPPDGRPMKEIDLNDPEISTIRLRGLLPESTYRLYIWARSRIGRGEGYEIETVTLPDGPPVAPNFTTVNISKRAINVTWFPSTQGNPGSVFAVHYRKLGEIYWLSTDEETDRNWAVINGLVPGVIYEMRVIARTGNGEEGMETSSPVRRVRIGVRRDLSQPTFKVIYLDKASFGVGLVTFSQAVETFYAQFRKVGTEKWYTTDDVPKDNWAIIRELEPGRAYNVRVVTKSDLGESMSQVQEVVAGADPDALKQENSGSAGCSPSLFTLQLWVMGFSQVVILGARTILWQG